MRGLIVIVISGALLGSGCAHDPMRTSIGWRIPYQLQPVPASLFSEKQSFTHEVTLERHGMQLSFTGHTQWRDQTLTLAGLTPFGRLFVVTFNDSLSGEFNAALPSALTPGTLLGDFELMFWPAECLTRCGLAIEDRDDRRFISSKGQIVATVSYSRTGKGLDRTATLLNHKRHYAVHVIPMTPVDGF